LDQKEEVQKFLLAVVARFKAFKKRVPSNSFVGNRPQRASSSKAKSSVLSELSGLENVVLNDFIDNVLDSEDVSVSEQRASASLSDSVQIESAEERAAREQDEMAVFDAVGDYEADPTETMEDVPQDIVFKTLKVSCAFVAVLVFACVCCVRAQRRYVFVRICTCIF
jgi:ATP-dependent DNA ligase